MGEAQQLAYLERLTRRAAVDLGRNRVEVRHGPAHLGEQRDDRGGRERFQRDRAPAVGGQRRDGVVEVVTPQRNDEQHIAQRRGEQVGEQQHRVLVGPLHVVDGEHDRPERRGHAHEPRDGPPHERPEVGRVARGGIGCDCG